MNSVPRHIFADTETQADKRHIGLFAGHIDGMAENITVAGEGVIKINGADINTLFKVLPQLGISMTGL
jgi:hypothetical protein